MSDYRRWRELGATYFFTVITADRRPIFGNEPTIALLRAGIAYTQHNHPFQIDAAVILPDHLHMLWTLPPTIPPNSPAWNAGRIGTNGAR